MGYYTDYDFSGNRDEVIAAINEICGYSCGSDDGQLNNVKWYDHDDHMEKVSLMFPNELLVLEGVGEEDGDIWKAYYKNGKSQYVKAVITFEPFDENKLK